MKCFDESRQYLLFGKKKKKNIHIVLILRSVIEYFFIKYQFLYE